MLYVDTILDVRVVVSKIDRNVILHEANVLEMVSQNPSIIYTKLFILEGANSWEDGKYETYSFYRMLLGITEKVVHK